MRDIIIWDVTSYFIQYKIFSESVLLLDSVLLACPLHLLENFLPKIILWNPKIFQRWILTLKHWTKYILLQIKCVKRSLSRISPLLFGKTSGKLKSGNDCTHWFHDKCFRKIRNSQQKASEVKLQLEGLVKKYQQLYKFNTRANLKTT